MVTIVTSFTMVTNGYHDYQRHHGYRWLLWLQMITMVTSATMVKNGYRCYHGYKWLPWLQIGTMVTSVTMVTKWFLWLPVLPWLQNGRAPAAEVIRSEHIS